MPPSRLLAAIGTAVACGCGASPSFTFQVTTYVPVDAKDLFSPSFDPTLHPTGRDGYRQPYVTRAYQTGLPPTDLPRPAITMTVSAQGQTVGSATLTPFVCDSMPDFRDRVAQGWSAIESAEAMVGADGSVQLEGTFDFPLRYTCELTAPGGGEGETAGTINAPTLQLCTEPARRQTNVALSSDAAPTSARLPTYCYADHKRDPVDRIEIWLVTDASTPGADDGFAILTSHCFGAAEAYPLEIAAPIPPDNSCGSSEYISLDIGPSGSDQRLEAISGGWSLDSVDLSLDGLVRGNIDATFVDASGTTYHAEGPIVLPNTMIPP